MRKQFLFSLGFILLFLFSSCANILEERGERYIENELVFGLEGSIARNIVKTVSENEQINELSELTVDCELMSGRSFVRKESKTVTLNKLGDVYFDLDKIQNNDNYFISLKIYFKGILIYEALSEKIILSEYNEDVVVNLKLQQHNSNIYYECDGGEFTKDLKLPEEYFINSDLKLPEPTKAHSKFDGWYLSKDFEPEKKVVSLGKNYFLGDVTLYAKWIELNKVAGVLISPDSEEIDDYEIILKTSTDGATIYYTTDGSQPTRGSVIYNGNLKITDDIIKEDKIIIKAIAVKDGFEDSDVTLKNYTVKRHTISFNNGEHGALPGNITGKKKGDVIDLPKLTATDFTFAGWFDGETKVHDDTYKYKVQKDVTLVGKWNNIGGVASVSFVPSQTPDENNAVDYRETVSLSCATPDATIWYTTDNTEPETSDTRKEFDGTAITIENDVTIKAYAEKAGQSPSVKNSQTYKVRLYSVTFNTVHGKVPQVLHLRRGDSITDPGNLSETGYDFGGWYSSDIFTEPAFDFGSTRVGTSHIDIYGKWTAIEYNIAYNLGASDATNENTTTKYTIESSEIKLKPPLRPGYTGKWCIGDVEKTVIPAKSHENINLVAKWTLNPVTEAKAVSINFDSIDISWKNPETSLSKVVITCTELPSLSINVTDTGALSSSATGTYKLNATAFDTTKAEYHFKLKAVKDNLESSEADFAKVVKLPKITSVSVGDQGPGGDGKYICKVYGENLSNGTETPYISGSSFEFINIVGFSSSAGDVEYSQDGTNITLKLTRQTVSGTPYDCRIKCITGEKAFSYKSRAYEIGDIAYTDGSLSKTSLGVDAKRKPVAVIFRLADTSKSLPVLGVALKESKPGECQSWAKTDTLGYTTKFVDIICNATPMDSNKFADNKNVTFSKDINGSDNWGVIVGEYEKKGKIEQNALDDCPAFKYALEYGTSAEAGLADTAYKTGWYIPSIAELFEIYRNKDSINNVLSNLGSTIAKTMNTHYWSSSQEESESRDAWGLKFDTGEIYGGYKKYGNEFLTVRCIRAF